MAADSTTSSKPTSSVGGIAFLILGIALIVAWVFWSKGFVLSARIYPWAVAQSASAPYFAGFAVLLLLWAFYGFFGGKWNPFELIRGKDNRWSTSKCQFFLWTVVALFSYASMFAARLGHHLLSISKGDITGNVIDLPSNLLLAMGLSVTTVLAAKGIVVNQQSSGATK